MDIQMKRNKDLRCVCGQRITYNSNFCPACGRKLKELCDCWVKKEPYNCGQSICPGYRLYEKLASRCNYAAGANNNPPAS
mgnify:CR=1 FL=1